MECDEQLSFANQEVLKELYRALACLESRPDTHDTQRSAMFHLGKSGGLAFSDSCPGLSQRLSSTTGVGDKAIVAMGGHGGRATPCPVLGAQVCQWCGCLKARWTSPQANAGVPAVTILSCP